LTVRPVARRHDRAVRRLLFLFLLPGLGGEVFATVDLQSGDVLLRGGE